MTKKEIFNLGIDITTFLHEAHKADDKDAAEVANIAIEMVKGILQRSPKLRYEIWQWNQEHLLDQFGLDYGAP
jgi:hypothetical protein